jgi:hypothetical protein
MLARADALAPPPGGTQRRGPAHNAAMLHPCTCRMQCWSVQSGMHPAAGYGTTLRMWRHAGAEVGATGAGTGRRLSRWAHSCALLVGVGVLVWLMPRSSGSWQMSMCRCRHPGVQPRQRCLDNVADVACQLCHSRGRETSLLLCDGCHRGYHRCCLTPALPEVPDGQWYCPHCVPSDPPPTQHISRRQRREGPWPSG